MMTGNGAVLLDVIAALDTAVADVPVPPDPESIICSVSMLDIDDLVETRAAPTDAVIAVGVDAPTVAHWLAGLPVRAPGAPAALMVKRSSVDAAVRRAAGDAGTTVVVIDQRARWDRVLGMVQAQLDRVEETEAEAGGGAVDLVGLVELIAQGTGGLVSIEDATSARVLAYSPSKGEADDLRVQTILGRAGPARYLELLRTWGVFDTIRRGGEVVDVPEDPDHLMRRRLVVGVHSSSGRHLGSIWVQQGAAPLADDAAHVLTGAAAVAARILTREMRAPSTEERLVQRVFGAHGGVDPATAGAYLRWPVDDPVAVVGVTTTGGDESRRSDAMGAVGGALRLHASAYAPAALTAVMDGRAYLLLPATSESALIGWLRGLVTRFDGDPALGDATLHAALVSPLAGLANVPGARSEVDRVLAATSDGSARVTTLAESRTAVLLGEILETLAARDDLVDPRLTGLREYDARHEGGLVPSVRAYLDAHGSVRDAARAVGVHANTLRYRLNRAQQLSDLRFDDPADRLLTTIMLAVDGRRR
ncbi:PucR family transcriptional regulator [Gordonia shandongensis]|uniref:PucR family transcriptional regulator n=1 Tax=Gordonia shandongensis TaxID=376351 RepID=UPI00040967EA|nr:PucR family transcriptional regulator [Gordonia shandongensis]